MMAPEKTKEGFDCMKLLLIRHGDPDYENDCLTPTGKREAELLAGRIAPLPIKDYYVSTMGRAMETAAPTLRMAGRDVICSSTSSSSSAW